MPFGLDVLIILFSNKTEMLNIMSRSAIMERKFFFIIISLLLYFVVIIDILEMIYKRV